jgi:O-methyltransferase
MSAAWPGRRLLAQAWRAARAATSPLATLECAQRAEQELALLAARVAKLEHRLLNYYTNRWNAVDMVADYLVGAELAGDYLEFGVFRGTTFGYVAKLIGPLFPAMRFIACDSFEGLPSPKGIDAAEGYSSSFVEGQFACSEEDFLAGLRAHAVDLARVRTVKGWFDQSLAPGNPISADIGKVAFAWIDGDFYESTVPVLDFLTTRLEVGSVLAFDDWHCYRNLADYGEQRACAEWLARNPQIRLNEFVSFGFHGKAFTVAEV